MPRFRADRLPPAIAARIVPSLGNGCVRVFGNETVSFNVVKKIKTTKHKSKWRAKPTVVNGIRFASMAEARAYESLLAIHGRNLRCHPRFPLLSIEPDDKGRSLVFTPDFVIVKDGRMERAIEYKPVSSHVRSRDYEIRRRAFEASYGIKVEEIH